MSQTTITDTIAFHIPTEGGRVKKHQVTAMHLIAAFLLVVMGIITFVTPIAIGVANADNQTSAKATLSIINWLGLAVAAFGLSLILITIFFNKKVIQTKANFPLRVLEIIVFIAILAYSLMNKWYLPAAYSGAALAGILIAYFLEKSGTEKRFIHADKSGIKIPGTGRSLFFKWQELKRVIIKHNLITIDCTNNKLYQLTFDKTAFNDENSFTEYCLQKIEENKHKQQEDW